MKFTLSKSQWKNIGKTAGWLKTAYEKITVSGWATQDPTAFMQELQKWAEQVSEGTDPQNLGENLFYELQDWLDDNIYQTQNEWNGIETAKYPINIELDTNGNYKLVNVKTANLSALQSTPQSTGEYDTKKLLYIFKNIPGNLNITDRVYTYSVTQEFNDVAGDAYISVSYDSSKPGMSAMHVEKYYDSEFLQDQMGVVKNVPINWNNPKETVDTVTNIINSWLGSVRK